MANDRQNKSERSQQRSRKLHEARSVQKNWIDSKNLVGSLHERAERVDRATLCPEDRTCLTSNTSSYERDTHIPKVLSKVETYKPHVCWATTRTRVSGACTICGSAHGLWKQWNTHTNHPHPKSDLLRMHCIPPLGLPHPPPKANIRLAHLCSCNRASACEPTKYLLPSHIFRPSHNPLLLPVNFR